MWMTAEDARSDFVLAAAAALFGPLLQSFAVGLPFYPTGSIGTVVNLAWLFAVTGLVPLLLTRYRSHGARAFGLDHPPAAATTGLLLAVPLALAWVLGALIRGSSLTLAVQGRLPVLSTSGLVLDLVVLTVGIVGVTLLYTFLTVRARDAFRATQVTQVEALRTFGMGAVGVAGVLGLLLMIAGTDIVYVVFTVLGVGGLVLLTDRYVEPGEMTTRATVLGPAFAVLAFWVFRGGGLFSGNLLDGLFLGTVAGGVTIVVAILIESRRYAWAAVPVIVAAAVYGTPLVL